ncbi:MAG: hypothetical protein AB8G17_12870 [Gammaproteobacteria bacterium]
MKKYIAISALALLLTNSAFANGTELEVGYQRQQINFDEGGVSGDLRLAGPYVTFGYRVAFSDTTSGTFEGTYARAFDEDTLGIFIFDEAESYGVGFRVTQKLDDGWALFARADYRQLDLRIQNFTGSDPEINESGFGLGAGVEWRGVSFGYSFFTGDLEDYGALSIGYRFRFGSDKW